MVQPPDERGEDSLETAVAISSIMASMFDVVVVCILGRP